MVEIPKEYLCEECEESVDECDGCDKEFEEADNLLCCNKKHYCSKDCMVEREIDYYDSVVLDFDGE